MGIHPRNFDAQKGFWQEMSVAEADMYQLLIDPKPQKYKETPADRHNERCKSWLLRYQGNEPGWDEDHLLDCLAKTLRWNKYKGIDTQNLL